MIFGKGAHVADTQRLGCGSAQTSLYLQKTNCALTVNQMFTMM